MSECPHTNLVLLPPEKNRLRCRHCGLTIKPADLEGEYCPECYQETGRRHYDFEALEAGPRTDILYRCEDCGAVIS